MLISPHIFMSYLVMIISVIMAMSSSNWLCIWFAMELNLLSFVPILLATKTNQETEGSIKYFLAQALGSSMLLLFSYSTMLLNTNMMYFLLMMAIMMKIGSFPCHWWFPSVMMSSSWVPSLILATWQKLAPLTIISFMLMNSSNMASISIIAGANTIIGGIMGMNQSQLRPMMAYSSISHMGWMMSMLYINESSYCMTYYAIYFILTAPIFLMLNSMSYNSSKTMNKFSMYPKMFKTSIIIMLLSLGGLPPLSGFMPKLMVISMLMESNSFLVICMILGSLLTLYFYLNIAMSLMIMDTKYKTKNQEYKSSLMFMSSILYISLLPVILMYAMTILY